MNSRKLFSLMAALALLALAPLAGFPPAAQASTTVTVCPLFCAYSQIQPAIDAASNGVTIVIAAGTFSGGIIVNKNVTLQGAGATATTISGGDPVVNVDAGVTASIDGVTITGHNSDAGWGGIFNTGSMLTVSNSIISGNAAANIGGGGIYNSPDSTLTVSNSTISDNTTSQDGGGIFNDGMLTVRNSTISGNIADGLEVAGGGIVNHTNPVLGTVGVLSLSNSTISGNKALGTPVGFSLGTASGGGIYNMALARLTVSNSTISDNTVNGYWGGGGGISNDGIATVSATILARNSASIATGGAQDCSGSLNDGGYNLLGDGTGCSGLTNDQDGNQVGTFAQPIDALLSPLQDNGGPTETVALWEPSPAIDAIPISSQLCPSTDQRGKVRPDNGESSCDIGAYEFQVGAVFTTAAALRSSANPSVSGQPVTYTAFVGPVPNGGTFAFNYDSGYGSHVITGCGAVAVDTSSGTATCSFTPIATGSYAITATYSGNSSYTGSTSNTVTQAVNQASTTTSLSSSQNPSEGGENVTFTATITINAPGVGTPYGTVAFDDSGTAISGCGAVAVNTSNDTATCSMSALSAGSYTITALYSGYHDVAGSTSNTLTQYVGEKIPTTINLQAQPNPSVSGLQVTFTATVSPTPDSGTVAFDDNGTAISGCGAVAVDISNGTATCKTLALLAGSHTVTALYSGDTSYAGSTSIPVTQTVNRAITITGLGFSTSPSVVGQPVTYTAIVSAATVSSAPFDPVPDGGTVAFDDNGTVISGCGAVAVDTSNGKATCTVTYTSTGSHSITAAYSGNADYVASSTTTPWSQTVNKASTKVSLTSSPTPSTVGQSITLTASVSVNSPGAGTPTGSVSFSDGLTTLGTVNLDTSGTASYSTSTLSAGTHTLTATYDGDSNFTGNTSKGLSQTVNAAALDTTTSATNTSVTYGASSVNLSASVSGSQPVNEGTITFAVTTTDGATTFCTSAATTVDNSGAVSDVPCSFGSAHPNAGSYTIHASYHDDSGSFGDSSATGTLAISKADANITVTPYSVTYDGKAHTATGTATGVNGEPLGGLDLSDTTHTDAGSYNGSWTFTDSTGNYHDAQGTVSDVIDQAILAVTPDDQPMTYGGTVLTFTFQYSGFKGTDSAADLDTPPSCSAGSGPFTVAGSPYPIICAGGADNNYSFDTSARAQLSVTPATLTITASSATLSYGQAIPDITASYQGLVNGDAAPATLPTCSTSATSTSNVGSYPTTCSGAADPNYTISYAPGTVTINAASATVTLGNLRVTYTGLPQEPTAGTTPTGLNVVFTYSQNGAPVTSPTNAGSYDVTATVDDPNYSGTASGTFVITPAPATITANNAGKLYGAALPAFSATVTGAVNGDALDYTLGTTATAGSNVGNYPISVSLGTNPNYDVATTAGTLEITPAPLAITASSPTITYGQAIPAITPSYGGLVNGDMAPATAPTCGSTATSDSVAGSYPTSCSGASDLNYTISYTSGTLAITPATLTVTADDQSVQYSDSLPALNVSYSGFVNGEASNVLSGTLFCGTTATVSNGQVLSPAGSYPITCSGLSAANYTITYQPGTLSVTLEDTVVRLAQHNPHAVQSTNKTPAPALTFSARITEVSDNAYGDISQARPVSLSLDPVGSGGTITATCSVTQTQPATSTSPGFQLVSCPVPGGTPINVYEVTLQVGGQYYQGSDASVLTVYDPSAGSSTAAGTVVNPSTGNDADVSYMASYLKNGQVQGKFLYVARDANGTVTHVLKGNVMSTMSISGTTALITGKATLDGVGNYSYILTGIDGTPDQYGQQVTESSGAVMTDLSFGPTLLSDGNIAVGK